MAQVLHIEQDAEGKSQWSMMNLSEWGELSKFKAEFEPDGHDWINTIRIKYVIPRIIRLLGYDRLPKQTVTFNRQNVYARDGNRCQYCGKKYPTTELSLDHIIPRSQNGPTNWENIVCACTKCNARKGGRTPEQAHMKLIGKPVKPKRSPVIDLRLSEERYVSWKQFVDAAYWSVELK